MVNQFLKKDTRRSIVIMSVFAALVAIALVMISILIPAPTGGIPKSIIICIISLFALFTLSIWNGVIQIKVFNDYKGQRKALCAEGIFDICLTVLVVISFVLFSMFQVKVIIDEENILSVVDLRYFIGVFVAAFAFWKVFSIVTAVKEKRKNLWIEILICALWLILAVAVFLSVSSLSDAIGWIGAIVSVLLVGSMTLFNLYSYIFFEPTYLVTEEALAILEKDNADRAARMNRLAALQNGGIVAQPQIIQVAQPTENKQEKESVEDKLAKLEDLKAKGLITEEEYAEKRKKIIDNF